MIKSKEFFAAFDQIMQERGLKQEEIISDMQEAMIPALKKVLGEGAQIRLELNFDKTTIRAFMFKEVVEDVEDWDRQISLEEANDEEIADPEFFMEKAKAKKAFKVGDIVENELNLKNFGRVFAITMKQVLSQKTKERARAHALEEINARADQIITARITKIERDTCYLEIPGSNLEGILNVRGQIPGQVHKEGDFLKVYVNPVSDDRRGEIYVTRSTPQFVRALFDLEVPEIGREEVIVKAIAREAGYRTKLCVYSETQGIDPIGSCVGNKGSRIQNVLAEIGPEKVDLIPWSEDPLEFIAAALSPSPVIRVEADEAEHRARVIVPNDKLSLAIGKGGMNVRLAAKLTGWKIDVKSEDKAAEEDASFSEEFTLGG
ncbi:MAG: transcription termination factor NusA [Firmicutes bacterium]|nr:transcription termination factor NusA [Bacillota bacterium]